MASPTALHVVPGDFSDPQRITNAINQYDGTIQTLKASVSDGTGIGAAVITDAQLANVAAWTLKGNNSGSAAAPQDFTIDALTAKAAPVGSDEVPIWDAAASQMKKATLKTIIPPVSPQGRITLTSATPVLISTVSGASTVYYSPYIGQFVPIWNGSAFETTDIGGELSQATTDNTKSPAAVAASSNYDVFVWSDGGTIRATRGPAWTSGTARGTGAGTTELVMQNGVLLNKNSITNGPAASRGTYVGTIRSNGSSTIDFILGGAASGGTAGVLNVWNTYNRVQTVANVTDNGASYTYTSATVRQARASAGNQVQFVTGLAEDSIKVDYNGEVVTVAAAGATGIFGVGLDSTTTFAFSQGRVRALTANIHVDTKTVGSTLSPQLGSHIISANEAGDAANANTFNGVSLNILSVMLRM